MSRVIRDMGTPPGQQAVAFALAVALGFGLGLFYDLLRLLRLGRGSRGWTAVLDGLFWCAACGAILVYTVTRTGGEIQLYALCAAVLGGWAYFRLLSPAVRRMEGVLLAVFAWLWRLFTAPFRAFWAWAKKFSNFFKKYFSFWRRWFTIIAHLGVMSKRPSGKKREKGGRGWYESETSGSVDQAPHRHFRGGHPHHQPGSPVPDPRHDRDQGHSGAAQREEAAGK